MLEASPPPSSPNIEAATLFGFTSVRFEQEDQDKDSSSPNGLGSPGRSVSPPPPERARGAATSFVLTSNGSTRALPLLPSPLKPANASGAQLSGLNAPMLGQSTSHGTTKITGQAATDLAGHTDKRERSNFLKPMKYAPFSQETQARLINLIPPQILPLLGAIPSLYGSMGHARRIKQWSCALANRAQRVAQQRRMLSPIGRYPAAAASEIARRQALLRAEDVGLKAARRTTTFHFVAALLEVGCILGAALPAFAALLGVTTGTWLLTAPAATTPVLLMAGGLMNMARYAIDLYTLRQTTLAARRSNSHLAVDAAFGRELAAEGTYLKLQLSLWSAFTLGLACVSGLIFASTLGAWFGAALLAAGIFGSSIQHALWGRRYDVPRGIWTDLPADSDISSLGPFGLDAFSALEQRALLIDLHGYQQDFAAMREDLTQQCWPALKPALRQLPHLTTIDGIATALSWLISRSLRNHPEATALALTTAHLKMWRRERNRLLGQTHDRQQRASSLASSCRAGMMVSPHTLGPAGLTYGLLQAETQTLAEEAARLHMLEADLISYQGSPHKSVDVIAQAWGLPQRGLKSAGAIICCTEIYLESWRVGLLWGAKATHHSLLL